MRVHPRRFDLGVISIQPAEGDAWPCAKAADTIIPRHIATIKRFMFCPNVEAEQRLPS